MDAEIKEVKETLRETIRKCQTLDSELKEICEDAADCLSIFKISIQSAQHRRHLINVYKDFLTHLQTADKSIIRIKIDDLMREVVLLIASPLNLVQSYLNQCFIKYQQTGVKKLSIYIGYVVGCSIYSLITSTDDFQTCWQMYLENIFINFQLIQHDNKYFKDYLAYKLCEESTFGYQMIIKDHRKIIEVCNEVFGNVRNFKFFKKACFLSKIFQEPEISDISVNQTVNIFKIVCSRIPKTQEGNQILQVNQQFVVSNGGLANSTRMDSLVFFGKHYLCDVRFPEDNKVDDICFVIYHNKKSYLVMDCSKKSYVKRKLQGREKKNLFQDMILDICHSALIRILRFDYLEDEEGNINGKLTIEFLSGELFGGFGGNCKEIKTLQKNGEIKTKFLLGKGSYGIVPDIRFSQRCIGREHLFFKFKDQNWVIYDNYSKNGTFLLLKNFDQYKRNIYSSAIPLFDSDEKSILCIVFDEYSFIFVPDDFR